MTLRTRTYGDRKDVLSDNEKCVQKQMSNNKINVCRLFGFVVENFSSSQVVSERLRPKTSHA